MVSYVEHVCDELREENKRLRAVLRDILGVAQTNKIIDKRGNAIDSCETTCLNEIATVAIATLKAAEE